MGRGEKESLRRRQVLAFAMLFIIVFV